MGWYGNGRRISNFECNQALKKLEFLNKLEMNEAQLFNVVSVNHKTNHFLTMKFYPLFIALLIVTMGCTKNVEQEVIEIEFEHDQLIATVMPVGESGVSGSVTFSDSEDGVLIQGDFEGLEVGSHGFHIHQYGDCSADDGTSAGGHFNPSNSEHGAPSDMERHMGDLGNIEASEDGSASIDHTDETVSLRDLRTWNYYPCR